MIFSVGQKCSLMMLMLSFFITVGCDKIPLPAMEAESVTVDPVAPPVQPEVTPDPKSPEQILDEFQALKSSEIEDHHLASIANLEQAQKSFETLDLSKGKVSDEGVQNLKKFKNIKSLNLSKTFVRGTGLQALEFDHLQELRLDSTQFNSAMGEKLKEFQSLKTLSIRETGLNDSFYEVLAELPNLEVLHLDGNSILLGKNFSEMVNAGRFENLRVLTASNSQFGYYGLLAVDKLKHLEVLNAGSTGLNLKAMLPISKCKNLKELNLSSNPLSSESLVPLKRTKSLEILDLSHCQGISDPAITTLRTMKQLKKLVLIGTSITPNSMDSLKKVLKGTEIVIE